MRGSINNNCQKRNPRGILLLEVILGLMVSILVLSGVFALASGSLALSEAIADEGREQISQETFLSFLERNFEALPGNAVLDLDYSETAGHFISEMTFQEVPMSFSWAGQSISPEAIQLVTVERADGTLDIVLRYYDEKILDDTAEGTGLATDPVAELILLRGVWKFEWAVKDARTMEDWTTYKWDVRGRMPLQLRLTARFHREGEEVVHYFWIPPKTNPSALIDRNMRQPSSGSGRGTTNPRTPTPTPDGDGSVNIPTPTR